MAPSVSRLTASLTLLGTIALAPQAGAQGPDTAASPLLTLRPGLPIRLVSPTLGLSGNMSVLRVTHDTLVVVGRFGERTVPRAAIGRLDVYEGHTTRGGLVRGARVGAVVGAGNAILCVPEERKAGLLLSVPAFGLAGAVIGTLFRADSYTRVLPPD
jgi:hypothetical protein